MRRTLSLALPGALALAAAVLLAGAAAAAPADASPKQAKLLPGDPSMPCTGAAGNTGLMRIPTAEVLPHGDYAVGFDTIVHKYRPYPSITMRSTVAQFVTVGVLPRVEVTATFLNHEGNLGAQYYDQLPGQAMGGWDLDREFGAQILVLPQDKRLPFSIGAGYQDLFGTGSFKAYYGVATHRSGRLGVHLGVGGGILGTAFGGVDYQVAPWVRLMLEHDGNHPNFGASIRYRRWSLTPMLNGLDALGGGICYRSEL